MVLAARRHDPHNLGAVALVVLAAHLEEVDRPLQVHGLQQCRREPVPYQADDARWNRLALRCSRPARRRRSLTLRRGRLALRSRARSRLISGGVLREVDTAQGGGGFSDDLKSWTPDELGDGAGDDTEGGEEEEHGEAAEADVGSSDVARRQRLAVRRRSDRVGEVANGDKDGAKEEAREGEGSHGLEHMGGAVAPRLDQQVERQEGVGREEGDGELRGGARVGDCVDEAHQEELLEE